ADRERQAAQATERQRAVGRGEGDAHQAGAFVHVQIGEGDGISVGGGEDERGVVVGRLGGGDAVDRRVIDGVDRGVDRVRVGGRTAGPGVAKVVAADGHGGRAVDVGGGGEGDPGERGVNAGDGTGKDHGDVGGSVAGGEGQPREAGER